MEQDTDRTVRHQIEALLKELKTITPKPVRYVVNTHFHYDHVHGNQVYPPDVEIIGHEYIRKMHQSNVLQQRTNKSFSEGLPAQIADMKQQIAKASDAFFGSSQEANADW